MTRFAALLLIFTAGCSFEESTLPGLTNSDAAGINLDAGDTVGDASVTLNLPALADLMGYWPLDGDWDDYSDSGFDGEPVGDAAFSNAQMAGSARSALFDGDGDYVTVGNVLNLDDSPITVSVWFRAESPLEAQFLNPLVDKIGGAGNYRVYIDDGGAITSQTRDASGVLHALRTQEDYNFEVPTWTHVVWTFDNNQTSSMYFDGSLSSRRTTYPNDPRGSTDSSLEFGHSGNNQSDLKGQLSNVAIWKRDLTGREITNLYSLQLPTYDR